MDEQAGSAPEEAEVRLMGSLAGLAFSGAVQHVPPGKTVLEVAVANGVPAYQRFICLVNDQVCAADYVLRPGDRAVLFPPIAGGGF